MEFEWDESKRRGNLRKHGIDFADSHAIFSGSTKSILDDRFDYGEERFLTFGLLDQCVVVIAHTEDSDRIRVISIRKATTHEQALFFQGIQD
jgi:hypothetical protein